MKLELKKDKESIKHEKAIKKVEKEAKELYTYQLVDELATITQNNIDYQQPFMKVTTDIKDLKDKEMDLLRSGKKKKFDETLKNLNKKQEDLVKAMNDNATKYQGYSNVIESRINLLHTTKNYKFNGRNLWNVIKTSKDIQKIIELEK